MTEKIRMTRDIHNFVRGKMDWESALDLWGRVAQSDECIDYLLMEMELHEYFKQIKSDTKDVVSRVNIIIHCLSIYQTLQILHINHFR